jgi:hypothetical protein
LSARNLSLLRPTIRAERSELWREPEGAVVTKANWRDNPWFPAVLEVERKLDLAKYPERYDHVDAIIDGKAKTVAAQSPGVPLGVIRNLLTARAGACPCAQYLEIASDGAA